MNILSEQQLDEIQESIGNELLKRGFTAQIKKFEEIDDKVVFETEHFQTTPVLFKELYVCSFSSTITRHIKKYLTGEYHQVNIYVSVKYVTFDNGENAKHLFLFSCDVYDEHKDRVFNITID